MSIIDPKVITSWGNKIDACQDCDDLAAYATSIITSMIKNGNDAVANIGILQGLSSIPTDLPSVISWITAMINANAKPLADSITQLGELTAAYATITGKITSKATALSCGTIPIPPFPHL